jgi:hypothetical protein
MIEAAGLLTRQESAALKKGEVRFPDPADVGTDERQGLG